ncbi:class I SAM-dependent methyltransferase [Methylocucumis oryzae]|uniref:SAM-dependent methyltransferase n=1 Tax=Methylocucumis oryzae TaxID=1632867 RepID=A0A0F3IJ57_9GAMM|nr:methyltransferase domain-containing protein [Methylocucumis oryzae]KJV05569.1 SAM-dependent methyltransferase [Methylocucumis oryzae]
MNPKTVLHVGCGYPNPLKLHKAFRNNDWKEIRLDIDANAQPDVIADMRDLSAIEAGSIDALWSSHNVEHLYPHDVIPTLTGFRRILKPDGIALITLPDLQEIARLIADDKLDEPAYTSPAGPIAPLDMLYGFRPAMAQGNLFMAHRTGFTAKTLAQSILRAGFATVTVQRERNAFNLWAIGFCAEPSTEQLALAQAAMFPLPVKS